MLTREENELLCRIGPGTPMGRLMRRYWLPMLLSSDLEPDGDPTRVRLLGEDLVAFRDSDGRIGLIDEYCPHRLASMSLARNEEGALECLYHGWRIDCTGRILDMPVEPEDSTFKDRIRAVAYATCEAGGIVWAYMGPADSTPPPPQFSFTEAGLQRTVVMRARIAINWAQGVEGVVDSAHSNLLHQQNQLPSADVSSSVFDAQLRTRRPSGDTRPKMEVDDTPYGFRYAAIRKPVVDPDQQEYVRISHFVAPIFVFFPAPQGWQRAQAFTPLDDETTLFWFFQISDTPVDPERRAHMMEFFRFRPGIDLDDELRPLGNRANRWLQDRAAMRRRESHTGISGINHQDIAVQESMGAIVDRTREHLAVSDTAVIRFRRLMLETVRSFERGAPPIASADRAFGRLRATDHLVPIGSDWRGAGTPAYP